MSKLFFLVLSVLSLMKKSKNILLFLLNIEFILIFLSFFCLSKMYLMFIFILMMGVMEAIMGLSLMIIFSRLYGNDKIIIL